MSQFNLRYVPTLSCDQFLLNGQNFSTQAANIPNGNGVITATPALTTEVIINDFTKNQALYAEIVGNIHGNVFPVLQAEINALEANVAILQGNVIALEAEDVNLQNQILLLSGNVVINANAIAELINDTQFLEAPYAGLAGNTSFFYRGLQVYNTPTDTINETTGTGIFSYLDGNVATGNQIQLRVEDTRNVFIKGSTTINTPSNGLVSIGGTGNTAMTFSVGNSTNNALINMNGNINLLGDGSSRVSVYTSSTLIPIPSSTKKVDIRGDDEANIFGKKITVKNDSNASLTLEGNIATISTVDQTAITSSGTVNVGGPTTNVYSTNQTNISAANGKIIDINCGVGGSNSQINIGTYQTALQTGYQKVSIGYQPTVPGSTAKTSTWIYGDFYRPYPILPVPTSILLLYDQLMYVGTPTPFSGGLNGPVSTTINPYFRSISTYCPDSTVNSFVQMSGVFTITVVAGAIVNTCGAGGYSLNVGGGLLAMTSLVGGVAVTCGAGAIQLTTGAGQIGMTTGAAPIVAETLYGDILLKAGYSSTSTPQTALGSIYLKARNYTYITPDLSVVVGSGVEAPFNSTIVDTITGNAFFGNLFTIANSVYSNVFLTPNITSSIVNPLYANLFYQGNIVDQTGLAQASIFYPNGALSNLSEVAIVPYKGNLAGNVIQGNIELTKFTFQYLPLPLNANVYIKIQPVLNDPTHPNLLLERFGYGTWQSNAQIQSNIGVLLNGYLEPAPPVYDKYLTVLGNASIQQDLECNANVIVIKDAFPLLNTTLTNNSVFTTGNVTCTTLNYTTLNPPIVIPNIGSGGVDSIIAGTNVSISPLNGLGNVVINCTLPNVAGVNSIIAGNGIEISPIGGQGNVTVSLAGSVIPPGGYLPIAGGTMTGSIYQFPSSNLFNNTVQKYRPVSSYQPPYPSIGPPSFTGELLTFFNGDNPPVQDGFTGWFTQNLIDSQPTVITEPIDIDTTAKFYETVGGTQTTGIYVTAVINNFKVGDHLQGGYFPYAAIDTGLIGASYFAIVNTLNGNNITLYKVNIQFTNVGPSFTNLPEVDFIYTAGQQVGGTNIAYIYSSIDPQGEPNITCNVLNGNWEGYLNLAISKQSSFMAIDNVLYEYFSDTNTIQKLLVVNGTGMGQPPKILGITTKQVATSNLIYIFGIFQTANVFNTGDVEVNNIFQYNVKTNVMNRLTATTASANAYGVNNAVYGVDVSDILNNSVFFWGDFTGSGAQGGVIPGDTNINCGFTWTASNIWTSTQVFGVVPFGTQIGGCRGGIIVQDYLGSPNTTALLLWAANYNAAQLPLNTITSAVVTYGAVQFIGSSGWPFGSPPPGTGGILGGVVSKMQIVSGRVIFMGNYIGSAYDGSNYVNSYSISSCLTNGNFVNAIYFGANFEIYAGSNDANFWIDGADQISVNTVQLQSNNTVIIGTNGYKVAPNGGGVMVYTLAGGLAALPVKQPISAILPYSVKSIIGNTASAVQLTCSLNTDNFFFSQTFNSTNPLAPPTTPTVNAINGAKFAVASTEMDKIVFSGSDTDYASVSFIAGDVEDGDKIWYWQSQVGAIDYFAGNVFYPNITSSPESLPGPTTSTWGMVLINGNIASKDIDMNNFNIINANTITPIAGNDLNVVLSGAGSLHITQSSTGGASQPMLELENTNGGANGGHFDFYKNSPSPALDDTIGAISLHAKNSSATKVEYARISGSQRQTTAGSENGSVSIFCCANSPTPTEMIRFNGDGQTGTGSIDTYKPFNISTNTIIGSTGSINLVNGLFTSILSSASLRVQDTTTTTTQTQISKTSLTVATLGINTVYGSTSIITTGSTSFGITNTSFSLNLTGSGMILNSGANLIQITQPLQGVTKLSTDRPGHKFYPDYVRDNAGLNMVTVPAPEIINQRLTIVNYGLTQNNVWAPYGDSQGNGVNFIFKDSQNRVWVANDGGVINIRDDTLTTPDLQTITVGGGSSQIYIIYEVANYVYIGGNFSNVNANPQTQYSISRFDISSFPYSFSPMYGGSPNREGVQGDVYAIADIGAGELIIGGSFTLLSDSTACNYICSITGAQSSPSSQTFAEYAGGTNGYIQALLFDAGYNWLWVGGNFTSVQSGAFSRNYCSALYVPSLTWDEVATNFLNANVFSITLTSFGQIFLAGDFTALTSGQNYTTYIDRSNPAVWSDTNLGGVPAFSQRNLAWFDGSNFGVLNSGGVWVNTSQLTWVFIENPTSAAIPASGNALCITIWSGMWKVGYSTTTKVYAHTNLPDSCIFNGNFKYGVGVYTAATLSFENTSQQFLGDPTCAFWIPIGTPICGFS